MRVTAIILLTALLTSACADSGLNKLGSSLLSQTGLISSGQADSLFRFGQSVAKSQTQLSSEEEYYIGRAVAANILSRYRPYNKSELTSYLNKIALTLAISSDRPETYGGYHVAVLDTSEINAMSAPGGFIFVSTGFLRIVPDEDALAAVLAHEVAHIANGHGLAAISEANMSEALLLLGKEAAAQSTGTSAQLSSLFGDSVSDVATTLMEKGYSRSQEYQADSYAAALLARAGYSPQALQTMLNSLENVPANSSGGWLSTHPSATDRQEQVSSEIEALAGGQISASAGHQVRAARFNGMRRYF